MKLTKSSYYQEQFTKLAVTDETISAVEFEECTFSDCSFVNCSFKSCTFIDCTFLGCVMSATIPLDCYFQEVTFKNSKIIGFDWTKAQHIEDISFESCQINFSNFRFLSLPQINIKNCEAKEVDFTECNLTEADFSNTELEGSVFSKTNLTKANCVGAKNYFIDARTNTITKAHFSLPEALTLLQSLDVILE